MIKNNESHVSPSVSSCYHDDMQGHEVVINDAAKYCEEDDQMSTGGGYNTVPEIWKILTTRNSALQCSYGQEIDNSSNLYWIISTISVLDNLNYVMALEDSGSRTAMLKILGT